jgi:MPBQ/MSBQ methyltransferase
VNEGGRIDLLEGLTEPGDRPEKKFASLLRFYHEVLGCEYQHYGLWEGDPLTLQGLKAAQERYSEQLSSWVPRGVRTVLDVGCGTGGNARKLAGMGFEVEGLSPDPYQRETFTTETGLPFHLTTLEEFDPERKYDLVLMSESSQYIKLSELFPAAKRCAPGGYLLVSDYFVIKKDNTRLTRSGHVLEKFLEAAENHGMSVERSEDITEKVKPTLELAKIWLNDYFNPSLRIILEVFHRRRPRLASWVFRLLRKKHDRFIDWQLMQDGELFASVKRYKTILFKDRAAPAAEAAQPADGEQPQEDR